MGRTYLVDSRIQQHIEGIASCKGWNIGLVIGQLSTQKDFVVHVTTSRTVLENESNLPQPESLEAVNEQLIVSHARQVKRMLTGGIDVIGIFVVGEADELKNQQAKLRQILFNIQKLLNRPEIIPSCHSDRVLLQICSRTRNLVCRTYDVKDPKSSAVAGEWKYQKIMDSFLSLSSSFTLETVIPIRSESLSYSLQKQMMIGLTPIYENIWNSAAMINNQLVDDDSLPVCPKASDQGKGRGKKMHKEEPSFQPSTGLVVTLLKEMNSSKGEVPSPEELDCGAKMLIRGTISSQAYVHNKASVAEAVQALKRDIVFSINVRCELLCNDLLQAEEEQDVKVLYEMPQRLYANLPNTCIKFCDYLFQDETLEDSVDRFRVLVELDITSDDLDASAEHLPEDNDLVRPVKVLKAREERREEVNKPKKSSPVWKYLGVASAAVAGVFSYWLATQEDLL